MSQNADYVDADFAGHGYYKVTYRGSPAPAGPFTTVNAMAVALDLSDYPDDGYIVSWDGEVLGSVPSLNPDDLVQIDSSGSVES